MRNLRNLTLAAALVFASLGLSTGAGSAAPAPGEIPPACPVAGPKPVDNPDFSAGTPLPPQHNINLANARIIVQAFATDVFVLKQHLECRDGQTTIVDTPDSDISVMRLAQEKGHDHRGDYIKFTLAYATSQAQLIQASRTTIADGVITTAEPELKGGDDDDLKLDGNGAEHKQCTDTYCQFTLRVYPEGKYLKWGYAELYVRGYNKVVFPDLPTAATKDQSQWPQVTPKLARI